MSFELIYSELWNGNNKETPLNDKMKRNDVIWKIKAVAI